MTVISEEFSKSMEATLERVNASGINLGFARGLDRAADIARECGSYGVERAILEALAEHIKATKPCTP